MLIVRRGRQGVFGFRGGSALLHQIPGAVQIGHFEQLARAHPDRREKRQEHRFESAAAHVQVRHRLGAIQREFVCAVHGTSLAAAPFVA
jgi:hypothetical protein